MEYEVKALEKAWVEDTFSERLIVIKLRKIAIVQVEATKPRGK